MIALIPVKGFRNSKTRLSPVLDEEARARLTFWMMERVLKTVTAAQSVGRILLVSQDVDVQAAGQAMGVESFYETSKDLNGALHEAVDSLTSALPEAVAPAGMSERILIIPADLPLLKAEDVDALAELGSAGPPCVVGAPSRRRDGTNALLIDPPHVISPAYGTDSFARHRNQAEEKGVDFQTYTATGLALDVDLPEDFDALQGALDAATRKRLALTLASGPVVPS